MNAPYLAYRAYCEENPDLFFFTDVYSTVDFSEKIFDNYKVTFTNMDFMGGWASGSPLQRKKLASYGLSSVEEAMTSENVRFVARSDYDTEWLPAYYRMKDREIRLEETERIGEYFTVYRILGGE